MGVHGLWPLLHPVARPVALETMGGKKLAIDSSIWLYQFQIAMRDKEGRALDNAHILGFLRRICKLLFYGIKPVFVFDGGAPTIKKVAISNRKNRKQGAKETAARTAEKLLAAQLRAAAIKQARKAAVEKKTGDIIDENVEYLDDDYGIVPRGAPTRRAQGQPTSSSPAQTPQGDLEVLVPPKKKYVHKDQYALPIIEGPISARGAPSDPRLATEAELRSFIEDMRPEDFDMDSEFFANLPVEAKYEIIGDLRIKSRQPNFKRVESMKNAPTALDFSRAQIMGLAHRNDLTQKLLTMTDSLSRVQPMSGPVRIAGERNKEYVLIKNDTSEGTGYILGVRGGGERQSSPVKIETTTTDESDLDKTSTDEDFEQVQIPTHLAKRKSPSPEVLQRRRELAQEALRQRYSPVKPVRRRGDSPVDDLPALPAQRPLFSQTGEKQKPQKPSGESNTGAPDASAMPFVFPDLDTIKQVQSALAQANGSSETTSDVRLGEDEDEDLQRAIAASKEEQWSGINVDADSTEDSDNESDVSFDEVETIVTQPKAARPPKPVVQPSPVAAPPPSMDIGAESDDSVEYVQVDRPPVKVNPVAQPEPTPVNGVGKTQMPVAVQNPGKAVSSTTSSKMPISASETTAATQAPKSTLQKKKPASLHLDIPDEPLPSAPPEHQPGRTPRPDLTDRQALRDTSPQLVHEENGVVQRDYAQQPSKSPSTAAAASPPQQSSAASLAPADSAPVARLSPRPSLMERTLSAQSDAASNKVAASGHLETTPPSSTLSVADENALTTGSMSVLDEIRAAIPDAEEGLDKGDLQETAARSMTENSAEPASKTMSIDKAFPPKKDIIGEQSNDRDSSPEITYEWSPSPEPVARKRATDPTLLPPDDPNYIPADIDFAEPGHELSDLDDDDREHLESFSNEQAEYAKFLAELKSRNLDEMEQEVETELSGLKEQDKRDKKLADDITQQMAKDIQHLLKVLGLPYVVAPMEAEAQCAELLSRSLVDGVITDDNDVFLFGASKVYKNMFNQNKYVECYLGTDIERELALDRARLIRLAHFLGSDYCDGLPGVGPVLGMELMAEFPGSNGLIEFRNWWLKVQRGRDTPDDHPTAFRRKFKKSKRELYIDEGWPNPEVARAYLHPTVDESDQPFFWGIPDLDALRDFLRANLGWGTAKTDELMLPIIRKMTGRAAGGAVNQSVISNFFDVSGGTGRYAPMSNKGYQSKRLQAVVKAWRQSQQRLAKEEGSEEDDDNNLNSQSDDDRSSSRGKGRKVRPSSSRKGSGNKAGSSSSRRSSKRSSSQADGTGEESDTAFNDEIEAKLAKMGVKRKRETPIGSNRVIKPAKKSKKAAAREAAPKPRPRAKPSAGGSANGKGKGKARTPLFADDSASGASEEDGDEGPVVKSRRSQPVTPADSDEYQE